MVKFIALYKKPADVDAFEKHYNEVHVPLAKKMPKLKRIEVAHMTGSPGGEPAFYMIAALYFDSKNAMFDALNSDEGKAAAKDVMGFAGDIVTMMFAQVEG